MKVIIYKGSFQYGVINKFIELVDDAFEKFLKIYKNEFQELLKTVGNPYGDGCASEQIVNVLKTIDLNDIIKKSFWDIKYDKSQ